jgi:hypothetical protein
MATPEGKVKAHLKKLCEARGWLCLPLQMPSKRGWPDRTILGPDGWCAFVEVKAEGVKHNKDHIVRQKRWLAMLAALGFPAAMLTGTDEVDAFIAELDTMWRYNRDVNICQSPTTRNALPVA